MVSFRMMAGCLMLLACSCASDGSGSAEDMVRSKLLDGQSAEFRSVARCQKDPSLWRGEVNAKNELGAFTGFHPFFANASHASLPESYDFSAMMQRCYG